MWYPPNQPYRRRMRRGFGFPFIFPLIIVLFYFHSLPLIFATFILAMIVIFLFKIFEASNPNRSGQSQQQPYYQPPVQTYQPPYYQPSTPTYQPPVQTYQQPYQQEEYKPYEQGYQSAANDQQSASSTTSYEDYEQPQAQYPEQMPPMEQR